MTEFDAKHEAVDESLLSQGDGSGLGPDSNPESPVANSDTNAHQVFNTAGDLAHVYANDAVQEENIAKA